VARQARTRCRTLCAQISIPRKEARAEPRAKENEAANAIRYEAAAMEKGGFATPLRMLLKESNMARAPLALRHGQHTEN